MPGARRVPIFGGYGEGDPPVPIPNTEVKPFSADGTASIRRGRVGRRRDLSRGPIAFAVGPLFVFPTGPVVFGPMWRRLPEGADAARSRPCSPAVRGPRVSPLQSCSTGTPGLGPAVLPYGDPGARPCSAAVRGPRGSPWGGDRAPPGPAPPGAPRARVVLHRHGGPACWRVCVGSPVLRGKGRFRWVRYRAHAETPTSRPTRARRPRAGSPERWPRGRCRPPGNQM